MDSQAWVAVAAAVGTIVALSALVVLGLTLRRTRAEVRDLQAAHAAGPHGQGTRPVDHHPGAPTAADGESDTPVPVVTSLSDRDSADDDRRPVVLTRDGRTIVLPSSEQVVNATMGRPLVRGAALSYGLAHALRPESRDRIRGLVRREFRRRRKMRLQAGRRAARGAPVDVPTAQAWLGTQTVTPAPSHREERR